MVVREGDTAFSTGLVVLCDCTGTFELYLGLISFAPSSRFSADFLVRSRRLDPRTTKMFLLEISLALALAEFTAPPLAPCHLVVG